MDEALTPTRLAATVGISLPYASQILSAARPPSRPLAIRIYRATGRKFGPIANASDTDIDMLERFEGSAAA